MEFTGKLLSIQKDWQTGSAQAVVSVNETFALPSLAALKDEEKLNIKVTKYRKKRSVDANALLWSCLGQIAAVLEADKWDVYLQMLKRYGKFEHIYAKPKAVEALKAQWREIEVVGKKDIDGKEMYQILCYFGSSTYDTKEFSVLLDGVISEMKEIGLETPTSEEMRRSLERWEKQNEKTI